LTQRHPPIAAARRAGAIAFGALHRDIAVAVAARVYAYHDETGRTLGVAPRMWHTTRVVHHMLLSSFIAL